VRLISTVHVLQECLAGVYGNNGISFIIIEWVFRPHQTIISC
jgi:hypothetical protein